jgi:CRISPR-associated exonuclease Cas4
MFWAVVRRMFYGEPRRREAVPFDAELRALTARIAAEAHLMLAAARTPAPTRKPGCRRCSLEALCRPARLEKPPRIARWLAAQVADERLP